VTDAASGFRVSEAPSRDVGRGLVRLDPEDIALLGLQVGDTVAIAGKRTTVARVMPAHAAQRRQKLIQMDGLVRVNAGAGLDEQVALSPAAVSLARSVTLKEIGGRARPAEGATLARLLDGIPMVNGDRVRAILGGMQAREFTVEAADPAGSVIIGPGTAVRWRGRAFQRRDL